MGAGVGDLGLREQQRAQLVPLGRVVPAVRASGGIGRERVAGQGAQPHHGEVAFAQWLVVRQDPVLQRGGDRVPAEGRRGEHAGVGGVEQAVTAVAVGGGAQHRDAGRGRQRVAAVHDAGQPVGAGPTEKAQHEGEYHEDGVVCGGERRLPDEPAELVRDQDRKDHRGHGDGQGAGLGAALENVGHEDGGDREDDGRAAQQRDQPEVGAQQRGDGGHGDRHQDRPHADVAGDRRVDDQDQQGEHGGESGPGAGGHE
ncbi:hypothetical protein [Phytohabitans rumicis]|uniref:hypothetical protein n=1 Tax=Phytohabitans rumicis TaxID=1076125 RepID=UPI001566A20E|nr:hypothetical protein [Phytohabitans rumicis]